MSGRHRLPSGDWMPRGFFVGTKFYYFRIKYRRGY